ncbi:NAD-dependent epimerase/dehydratase [Flagelloscypha sp. PMI_526]|nr:NAD-dependent epimerase/dehydratase [Flagelloscypha sp. PMI_526]
MDASARILVTGGNGFLGSHLAKALHDKGHFVRIFDISPTPCIGGTICNEFMLGNACDLDTCRSAMKDINVVLHLAANVSHHPEHELSVADRHKMGGMGTIHEQNEMQIYFENHTMTFNLLIVARDVGVHTFFYASSACVYPEALQSSATSLDVSLREDDVFADGLPHPQGLYGLEKLISELLLFNQSSPIAFKIARFHNVYGPGGVWYGGREKAPAAMLRKAFSVKELGSNSFEIWGTGAQRRSFLYIDDAVDACLRLLASSNAGPVNIGSTEAVSVLELSRIALEVAGLDPSLIQFDFQVDRPVGVASRNSNNDFACQILDGWTPMFSLREGMKATGTWISHELCGLRNTLSSEMFHNTLSTFQTSHLINLKDDNIIFAILLPVTSRGIGKSQVLHNIKTFAQSLLETTWRDRHSAGSPRFEFRLYLGVDRVDVSLRGDTEITVAEQALREAGISPRHIAVSILDRQPGHVCALWRDLAVMAYKEGCDYFTLLGDDVRLLDEGWMRKIHAKFLSSAHDANLPVGAACIAFTDISFPGMPTFPVVHRFHMDVFKGQVIPEVFVNQDGDPFLFQLYRRWGTSSMVGCRISNGIGGSDDARYKKKCTSWTFSVLDQAVASTEAHLSSTGHACKQKLTLDVIVPSYRVQMSFLEQYLALQPSPTTTTMFIIIVDNPNSLELPLLQSKYNHRPDVRIRVNKKNLGAAETRNRGLRESSADWVVFLDDDVTPASNLLVEIEKSILAHPTAAGFVGNVSFPLANTVFKTAAHIAGVTFFWNIAERYPHSVDLPWGVTACLVVRRHDDGVIFDKRYPKTGGGEDIDLCRLKRNWNIQHLEGGVGFVAAPNVRVVHPWWAGGKRNVGYQRFYMWAYGDGGLIGRFPEVCWCDWTMNAAEWCLVAGILFFVAVTLCSIELCFASLRLLVSTILANVLHDAYRHLSRDARRLVDLPSSLARGFWVLAVAESSFVRMSSEMGRLVGIVRRREWASLGLKRFDWFCGELRGANIWEERVDGVQRVVVGLVLFVLLMKYGF